MAEASEGLAAACVRLAETSRPVAASSVGLVKKSKLTFIDKPFSKPSLKIWNKLDTGRENIFGHYQTAFKMWWGLSSLDVCWEN